MLFPLSCQFIKFLDIGILKLLVSGGGAFDVRRNACGRDRLGNHSDPLFH